MIHPYDLSHYKLTLPINKAGLLSGRAYEVFPPVPVDPYFQITDAGFIFMCPAKGATTATASNPRTELRDKREYAHTTKFSDRLKLKVLQCPLEAKVVVHQIHDADEPWLKMVWHQKRYGGLFYALIKASDGEKDTRLDLLEDVGNAQSIISYFEYDPNGLLMVKGNKAIKRLSVNRKGLGGKAYPKRGCYPSIKTAGLTATVLHTK